MKKAWIGIFVTYILLLIYFVVFSFQNSGTHDYLKQSRELGHWYYNLYPFRAILPYLKAFPARYAMENIFGNIIVFSPFGFLLAAIFPALRKLWKILLICFFSVLFIEIVQLISMYGFFDIDDIILNCVGGMLGYSLYLICRKTPLFKNFLKD